MTELYRDAIVVASLLGALLLLTPSLRWRPLALVLALGALGAGLGLGFLIVRDLAWLPVWTGLSVESASLVAWALFALAARRAPRPWLPGPPVVVAWLAGALFGEIAGAALVAAPAKDRGQAARLAMAAAAGGLVGRAGDPALLALGDRLSPLWLLPVSGLLLGLAWPKEAPEPGGSRLVTVIGLLVAIITAFMPSFAPSLTPVGLALGAAALFVCSLREGRESAGAWREVVWVVSGVILALVGAISGLWELLADSLEWMASDWGYLPLGLLAGMAGLISLFIDGPAAGLSAAAVVDRALDLRVPGLAVALAVGIGVGGLGPLVIAGAVREGFRRWVLAVVLAAIYVQLIDRWLQPV